MHLGSLNQALENIEIDGQDVEMTDVDHTVDMSIEMDSSDNRSRDLEAAPPPPATESADPSPPPSAGPLKVPVSTQSALVAVPQQQDTLWPSQRGAQTALPHDVHHILEVDMPIPAPWHQNISYTISTYIYLAFNFGVVSAMAWLFQLLYKDVNSRMHQKAADIMHQSAKCAREYVENECRRGLIRPALEQYCHELERCMDQDPSISVYRINTVARALAEAINEFFEPLSTKAILLVVASTVAVIYFANFTFGFIRARAYYAESPPKERLKYKLTPVDVWSKDRNFIYKGLE